MAPLLIAVFDLMIDLVLHRVHAVCHGISPSLECSLPPPWVLGTTAYTSSGCHAHEGLSPISSRRTRGHGTHRSEAQPACRQAAGGVAATAWISNACPGPNGRRRSSAQLSSGARVATSRRWGQTCLPRPTTEVEVGCIVLPNVCRRLGKGGLSPSRHLNLHGKRGLGRSGSQDFCNTCLASCWSMCGRMSC